MIRLADFSRGLGFSVVLVLVGCVHLAGLSGCSWMDQDDMKRYAIRRAPDPDDEDEKPVSPSPPAQDESAGEADGAEQQTPDSAVARGNSEQAATQTRLSDTQAAPAEPLSAEERASRSEANLERIAAALLAYEKDKGAYPSFAIRDRSGNPLLSWRVELLPYLGFQELYAKFDRKQPWYAPANKALIEQIPAVYQSPERFDGKTCYRLPTGSSTIFQSRRTLLTQRVEDGLGNTVMLVETDEPVSWTEPKEYKVDPQNPAAGLGTLRGGMIYLVWANGLVGSVPASSRPADLKAMFTPDTGEPFTMASINRPIDPSAFAEAVPAETTSLATSSVSAGVATPRRNSRTASGQSADTRELANTYQQAASLALANGESENAWRWYYGAAALGTVSPDDFAWYPALRRPASVLHYGIGLIDPRASAGPRVIPADRRAEQELAKRTAPFGESFLDTLRRAREATSLVQQLPVASGAPASRGGSGTRRQGLGQPSDTTYLVAGDETELKRFAEEIGCDVLVTFKTSTTSRESRRGVRSVRVGISVVDLVRNESLLRASRLEASSDDPPDAWRDSSAYEKALWSWRDLLEDGLSPSDWPVKLRKSVAAKRLAALGASRDRFPLRPLVEMNYYRDSGLVDDGQMLVALRELIGEEAAMHLLLGDIKKKRRALREWLPRQDAGAFIEEATRVAARINSDDDD